MGVLRTLNVDEILARQESGELKRRLRGRDLIGFGVGIIIGTGIFTLAGVEAKNHAGPAVTLSFVIGAVVAGLAALCYAELASTCRPRAARTPTLSPPSARSSRGSSGGTSCWSSPSARPWSPVAGLAI
jgi:amino acid permease